MNIQPISINNTVFKTCARHYNYQNIKNFSSFETPIVRTSTNIFRDDLNWEVLTKYVIRHFFDKPKVQTYSLACSDGSEAYSYAIVMLNKLPDYELKKHMPIKAFDIDQEIIKTANTGRLNIADFEFDFFDNLNLQLKKYFTEQSRSLDIKNDKLGIDPTHSYKVADKLRNCVEFKVGEILDEMTKINDEGNSLVLCRNVFPYFNEGHTEKILSAASKYLKSGSLFVTGCYDEKIDISKKILQKDFFNPIPKELNIFQKR